MHTSVFLCECLFRKCEPGLRLGALFVVIVDTKNKQTNKQQRLQINKLFETRDSPSCTKYQWPFLSPPRPVRKILISFIYIPTISFPIMSPFGIITNTMIRINSMRTSSNNNKRTKPLNERGKERIVSAIGFSDSHSTQPAKQVHGFARQNAERGRKREA